MTNFKYLYLFVLFALIQNLIVFWDNKWEIFNSFLVALSLLFIILLVKRKNFKFRKKQPITPIYKIKEKYGPILGTYLYDNEFQLKDKYAGIIYLIQKNKILLFKKDNKYFLKLNFQEQKLENIEPLDLFLIKIIFQKNSIIIDCIPAIRKESILNCWLKPINKDELNENVDISWIESDDELKRNMMVAASFLGVYTENLGYQKVSHIFANILIFIPAIFLPIIIGEVLNSETWSLSYIWFLFLSGWLVLRNYIWDGKKSWKVKSELENLKLFVSKTIHNDPQYYKNLEEFVKNENAPYIIAFSDNYDWVKLFENKS